MSATDLHTKLELHLHPGGTSSKSTGTDLSMEDIGHLEELQREIRQLREEVALLEAKLRLKDCGGEPQHRKNCGGTQALEHIPSIPPVHKAGANPRPPAKSYTSRGTLALRGGPQACKSEPVEPSNCAYSGGLRRKDVPPLSLQCYSDPGTVDLAPGDADALPEVEHEPGLSLHCYSGPSLGYPRHHGDQNLVRDLEAEPGLVKTESVSLCGDDGGRDAPKVCSVRLVDCKNTPEVERHIKDEEEELDGYQEEDFIPPGVAVQSPVEGSDGPPAYEESPYGAGAYISTPTTSHFLPDHHLNGCAETEMSYSCFWCGKEFLSPSVLRIHLTTHAEGSSECFPAPAFQATFPSKDKLYPCIHCGETFTDLSHCKTHEKTHAGEGPYRCAQCGISFTFLYSFQNHQKEHSGEPSAALKPYQCSYCRKQFATKATLIIHSRVHTGERPYQCCFCDQAFTRSDRLKEHERIHTGEKPFQCNACGKQFSQSASLRTHQRIHTGEKPYRCSSCGKQFSDLTGLRTHERQHTGEKPYRCLQCGKSFTQASNLRAHRKTHEAEQAALIFSV